MNKALLGSDRAGQELHWEAGPAHRPLLVLRAVPGAESRAPWAWGLLGLLIPETTVEGEDHGLALVQEG